MKVKMKIETGVALKRKEGRERGSFERQQIVRAKIGQTVDVDPMTAVAMVREGQATAVDPLDKELVMRGIEERRAVIGQFPPSIQESELAKLADFQKQHAA